MATTETSTGSSDLQKPPRTLPISAPILGTMVPGDIPRWKREWKKFLFGNNDPETLNRPRLRVRQIGPALASGRIERLTLKYNLDDDVTIDAYLVRPKKPTGRLPGIVLLHETEPISNPWKRAASLDHRRPANIAAHLAQRGCVVLVPKCFIFAGPILRGRKRWDFKAEVKKVNERHPAWKGLGRMIVDDIRAVDVLQGRPDVDPDKIGAIGHSLGGKQIPFVMAFDRRIKAGVSSDGGIGLRFSNWDDDWYLSRAIHYRQFENNQILAMIAPRAFLLVGGRHDDDRAWPFIAGAIPLWKAKRAPENVGRFRHDRGHCWPLEAHDVAYSFLLDHLANSPRNEG